MATTEAIELGALRFKPKKMQAAETRCEFEQCGHRARATMLICGWEGGRYCQRHVKELSKVYDQARRGYDD